MDGQACLNRHADIRRATVSEERSFELTGTANSVSCTVSRVRYRTQQQNSRYPSTRKMTESMTPHTRFGSSIMINIPIAVQNNAKPHTFFMLPLPSKALAISYACA